MLPVFTRLRSRYLRQHTEARLLRHLLKQVSRSFYLSLRILGSTVRKPISLAYLFCRAADTLVDTPLIPRQQRWETLQTFRQHFLPPGRPADALPPWRLVASAHDAHNAEYQLAADVPQCFALLDTLPAHDRRHICHLVLSLTHGMEMDLAFFPAADPATVHALPTMATLDLYTYYVAGVVGEFWTKIHADHVSGWPSKADKHLCALGIHFGKGLQMTNILKDLGKDVSLGRCYIPREHLRQVGLVSADLLHPASLAPLRPLLRQLLWHTLDHLDHGCQYILDLPYHTLRLRLSCMWPLFFAVQTLEVVWNAEELLTPTARVRITRRSVYRTLWMSLLCLIAPGIFVHYYRTLRRSLTKALSSQFPG